MKTTTEKIKNYLRDNNFITEIVMEGKYEFPKSIFESQNGACFSSIEDMEDAYDGVFYDNGTFTNTGFRTFGLEIEEEFPDAKILFDFKDRQDMHSHVEVTEEFCVEFPEFYVYGWSNPGDEEGNAKIIRKREASRSQHQELEAERPRR